MDTTMELAGFPPENTKAVATRVRNNPGGPVLRALIALTRLGHRTEFVSAVGSDAAGADILAYLREQGVGTGFLSTIEGPSRQASVWLNQRSGSRTIAFADQLPTIPRLPGGVADTARAVMLDGREYTAALGALESAPRDALRSIDTGGSAKEGLEELVALCDCVVVPKSMLATLSGGAGELWYLEALLGGKASLVVVTGTESGAVAFSREGAWIQPSFDVATVDSNGAGDSFHAGLVHAVLNGVGSQGATRMAAAVAAMKCMGVADTGLPTQEELASFLVARAGEAEALHYSKTNGVV
jgi:sulfofructose kinase